MTMKSWVLHRVQGLGGVAGRGDLPPRERGREPDLDVDSPPTSASTRLSSTPSAMSSSTSSSATSGCTSSSRTAIAFC
jgi:hypothetical protein